MFSKQVWTHALILLLGAILAPGKRTVTSALQIMGLADEKHFINYHRVLSRAQWSALSLSRILLGLLVTLLLSADAPLIVIGDDTLERRRGKKIKAKGVFRDAVRSSQKKVVTCFGLRWVCLMLLVPLPWTTRPWALPFLTVLAPSERANQQMHKRHKTCIDWLGQMITQVRRWWPTRRLILLADGGYAALALGLRCGAFRLPVIFVTRLRLDGALYEPPSAPRPGRRGPKPKKGARQVSLATRALDPNSEWLPITVLWYDQQPRSLQMLSGTALWYTPGCAPLPIRWILVHDPAGQLRDQAFLCTEQTATPEQILQWVIMRWNIEVTFEEVRAHLGVETQRQWSEQAIARTTPLLLGLFSLVSLIAHELAPAHQVPISQTAWYQKEEATFADVLAFVRRQIWQAIYCVKSTSSADTALIPPPLVDQLMDALCYAA